jgi:Na+-driven multidrug efflux pump
MTAYTIIGRLEQIIQQPYGSLSAALTVFTGQNIGAGKLDRVKKGYRQSILIVLGFSLIMIPIAWLFSEQIVGIFVKDAEVIAVAKKALYITSTCYLGLGMIYVPRAILNGSGDTGFAMINGITEVTCRILYSQVLTRIPILGYWGIWVTTGATWITTAIICIHRYSRGKWKTKTIIPEKNNSNP